MDDFNNASIRGAGQQADEQALSKKKMDDKQLTVSIRERAADEIERLQAENESLARNGGQYMKIAETRYEMFEKAIARAEKAEIENERLKAENRKIVYCGQCASCTCGETPYDMYCEELERDCYTIGFCGFGQKKEETNE